MLSVWSSRASAIAEEECAIFGRRAALIRFQRFVRLRGHVGSRQPLGAHKPKHQTQPFLYLGMLPPAPMLSSLLLSCCRAPRAPPILRSISVRGPRLPCEWFSTLLALGQRRLTKSIRGCATIVLHGDLWSRAATRLVVSIGGLLCASCTWAGVTLTEKGLAHLSVDLTRRDMGWPFFPHYRRVAGLRDGCVRLYHLTSLLDCTTLQG
ncbi:hypothetical protein FKP32DRAFT_511191 [Trametes sanguinea]|nr:hypothetical protein FKP32DRAFT_511191 [Trametes sanguinea]